MVIQVRPALEFDDVRAMLGPKRPDANVCWCLSYRIPSKQNLALRGPERGALVKQLVDQDPPPGVLAYDGEEVVGWAGVHPRADTSFARNRRVPHVDDLDVWSVWCIRVAGAVQFALDHGAPAIEGYPVDNMARRSTSPWPMWVLVCCSSEAASPRSLRRTRRSTDSRGCSCVASCAEWSAINTFRKLPLGRG
jgi:hypothetical protein